MKYHALVKKIIDLQKDICPAVQAAEEKGLQDADTHAKMEAAERWAEGADKKLGEAEVPTMAPDITPVVEFSNHLHTYQQAFTPHVQSLIEKYREYVDELFHEVEQPDVPKA